MSGLRRSELADALGLSRPMIGKYAEAGMPFDEDGRITLAAAKRWITRNIQKRNTDESFQKARTRKEQALASLRELELKQKSAQVVDIGVFERTIVQLVSIYRQRMLCVPANVAPMVAAETDIAKCHAIIEASVYEAMEDFSRTELEIEDPGGQ